MNLKAILDDEAAVSPVIGVILMVAITVILAAVIGTFVLGLGDQVQNTSPQSTFTFDYAGTNNNFQGCTIGADDVLHVSHDGGEKVSGADLSLQDSDGNSVTWSDCDATGADTAVTAGDTAAADVDDDDTIRVIWNPGSDNSATIGKWAGPDA